MAAVTGPISTLPGTVHKIPAGMVCDDHPHRRAVVRIQGETDSFGSEMADLCQECYDKCLEPSEEISEHFCDWCKCRVEKVEPMRDFEEGRCGPVYYVCASCAENYKKKALEDLDEDVGFEDDYFDDAYDEEEEEEYDYSGYSSEFERL